MSRQLVTIREVSNVFPIEKADAIEAVQVDGWVCVAKKGDFTIGQKAVYFEIDSFIPADCPADLLDMSSFKDRFTTYLGVEGMRVKTIRLRGQLSQGLLTPLPAKYQKLSNEELEKVAKVVKWESASERENNNASGNSGKKTRAFPSFIIKTDQERVQNLSPAALQKFFESPYNITYKLDGSSCTLFAVRKGSRFYAEVAEAQLPKLNWFKRTLIRMNLMKDPSPEVIFGVCSRNVWLTQEDDSVFWQMARQYREKICKLIEPVDGCRPSPNAVVVQGEIISPSIQGNHEQIDEPAFHAFGIGFEKKPNDYIRAIYVSNRNNPELNAEVAEWRATLNFVPTLSLQEGFEKTVEGCLKVAEGKSMNGKTFREGVVFWNSRGESFKAISNSYLLKKEAKSK